MSEKLEMFLIFTSMALAWDVYLKYILGKDIAVDRIMCHVLINAMTVASVLNNQDASNDKLIMSLVVNSFIFGFMGSFFIIRNRK